MTDINLDGIFEETFSALANRQTGLGTSRDKTTWARINHPHRLTDLEINALYRSSNLLRRIVDAYPKEASRTWLEWTSTSSRLDPRRIESFFNNFKGKSIKKVFKECSIEARLHGDSFALIGADDGQDLDKPLNENKIKSFTFLEPLNNREISPYDLNYGLEPEYYFINYTHSKLLNGQYQGIKIHRSRLLHFVGNRLTGSALLDNAGKHDSIVDGLYSAFSAHLQGLMATSAMLQDYSLFVYKLKGLAKLIDDGKQDLLLQRFLAMQMGMSVVKGLIADENEDVSFVERNFSGSKEILESLLDYMVANSDIPKFIVLGSTTADGRGTRSTEEREEWASLVHSWEVDNWSEPLERIKNLALKVMGVKSPSAVGFRFKSTLKLTALEEQELRLKKAQENKINIESGIYHPYEARISQFGGPEFHTELTLDERFSAMLEKEMLNPKEEKTMVEENLEENTEETEEKDIQKDSVDRMDDEDFDEYLVFDPLQVLAEVIEVPTKS